MDGFGERLKALRGKESQASFAARLGLSQVVYGRYELNQREPNLDVLYRIGITLSVSADWLLGLPDRSGGSLVTGSSGVAIATGGGNATVSTPQPSCSTCPYKALAEALKKVQAM